MNENNFKLIIFYLTIISIGVWFNIAMNGILYLIEKGSMDMMGLTLAIVVPVGVVVSLLIKVGFGQKEQSIIPGESSQNDPK
jgi:hypothetical protein